MDYFVKKTWIRIAVCAVLVAVGVLAMTGVFSGNQPLKYDPASVNGATVVSTEATEQGFGGDVTVHATIADNAISELTIDTPNETEGLGKRASDAEFTEQFIGKTGPFTFGENGIEALSGATVTSNAALKAINKAIGAEEPAAGEPAEEKAEEPAAETEAQTMEEGTEEPAAEPAEAETALGTTEQGFGGDVTVHVTLDGDKVQALTVDTPNETAGLGQRASEEAFTSQFIGKSAPFTYGENGIEALTGATITSDAVLKAINRAAGAEEAPSAEPEQAETAAPAAEEKTAGTGNTETAASAEQAYGVYRATKENAFSKVTVTASAKNGKLTGVQITSEGEEGKDLLTDAIREEWAKAILESGSAAPDAITGASLTFSAGSVQEAMTEILAEMNGGTAEPAVETAEEPATEPAAEPAEAPAAAPEEKAEAKAETSDGQAYGVYRSTKENAFSKVTVTASAKNGKLTDVQISSEGEEGKDLLTDAIREEWAKAILESGSAASDAITGATLTFSAGSVQEAMTEILAEMNGGEEPATEQTTAEPVDKPAEKPTPEQTEEPAEDPAADVSVKTPLAYAGYRAEAENQFSKVTVIASAKNGQLTNVKILSEGEGNNDLLTDEIKAAWAKAILESGSAAPDAITGASLKFSAGSVQEAMTEILNRMAGNEPATAEESASEIPAEETEKPAESGNGLLSLIAVSMGKEQDNSYVTDYLEQDPYLVNIYEGYGFAKDYGSARGHYYTLTDVEKTQRPHPKANCLTCKTPDMHKMIEEQGVSVYSMPFDDVMAQMTQPISCYTCHGADDGNGGKMVVTHQYVNEALGENVSGIKAASLSCGQCHIEYYFTPEASETMMPYHSVAEMTPEAILAYYDGLGFFDWEQPGTGTRMLKAQHPELETWSYGKHAAMLSCADCHMPLEKTESGVQYHDHHLVSPLKSETLLAKCATCHGSAESTIALVQDIQTKVTARETEVGNKLSSLKDELTAAVSTGRMSADELDAVRKLHREAQWFFDFCYVENSEGAHNSELAYRCLDTAEAKINEARGMLASTGTADAIAAAPAEDAPAGNTPAETTSMPEDASKTPPAYAGYRVEKENAFSRITVIAGAKGGTLTSLKIRSEGEEGKDLLTEDIKTEWAKAILESQSASPDAITGATLTFSAGSVQEAVAEILEKAAGK